MDYFGLRLLIHLYPSFQLFARSFILRESFSLKFCFALFNSSFSAKVNQVTVGDKVGSRYVFDLSFQNLDANVLAVMNRKLRELQTTTHDTQRLLWALLPDLPALLSKGARVSLDNFEMNMNMPSGRVKMDLNLSLPNYQLGCRKS